MHITRRQLLFWAILLFAGGLHAQPTNPPFFTDDPSLSPDGKIMVFTYAGDLWQVATNGGLATRLTALDGDESRPRISPDGQWLAFSANQSGNTDVYVMPIGGGEIVRLTYHSAPDNAATWSWDSKTVLFESSRYNRLSIYSISREGGTPVRLFGHFHNTVHNPAIHPKTGAIFFNESWESSLNLARKRYKGPYNPDIKSYNPKTQQYQVYTTWEGKDFGAIIDRQGTTYFLSDESNGEYNLYLLEAAGKKQRLTNFPTSIWNPNISADGSKIAFRRDYQLYVYEVSSRKTTLVPIRLPEYNTLPLEQDFSVKGNITAFDPSPDGQKLAFVSRGRLFVSDSKGKFVRELSNRDQERVMEVYWLKDSKSLIYSQTVNGHLNWFTCAADGSGSEKQVTNDTHNNRLLSFNSKQTQAVYLAGRQEIRLLDLESMTSKTLLRETFWDLYSDRPQFGPDDRHIVFTAYRDFERDIFVHDLQTNTTRNLTQTGVTEAEPTWTPDGRYLLYTSNPTVPSYPFGLEDANIYRLSLQAYDEPYRSDKFNELFAAKDTSKKEALPTIIIEEAGLLERTGVVGPEFGTQGSPFVIQQGDKTIVLFQSNHDKGRTGLFKTVYQPFEEPKTEAIAGVGSAEIRGAGKKYYVLSRGTISTLDIDGNKTEALAIDYTFRRPLRAEFNQMFTETWVNLKENFYDEKFHGVDWEAMRDRYAAFLPHITDRSNLRMLLNDMLGELNSSHLGFRSTGPEESVFYKSQSAGTGVLFSEADPYRVDHIVRRSPASLAGKDIQPGDRLVAVDGVEVSTRENRERYFVRPSLGEELSLTFSRGDSRYTVKIHPVSTGQISSLLYEEWEDTNQERVDTRGKQRIAYVHMRNMSQGELDEFLRDMVSDGYRRDALILDLRYNTGGNVHDKVLQFLSQRPYLQWKYRENPMSPQPNFGPAAKPIVLLTNEQSLSDAEMTSEGFKVLQLGKIIGMPTYRWIIFTSGKSLVDGSFYRLPSWGCYSLDGDNLEKTGVVPDIIVNNTFVDRIEGRDPQLDRAIDWILGQLK